MRKPLKALAAVLSLFSVGLGALHLCRARSSDSTILSVPKMLSGALSPFVALAGAVGAALGFLARSPLSIIAGVLGSGLAARYVQRVTASHDGFARAFGVDWEACVAPRRRARMLERRWVGKLPRVPEPCWERDVAFYTVPGTDRELLCDVWQPPVDVPPSGLAFVYLHGSGWHFLDKDVGTRPMFRHLAAQGHVIMDVAYRLCPETDWRGMVDDVKHAIAWIKINTARYGGDPEYVVLAGGSAGGHLALLAAYTARDPDLTTEDLGGADLSVRGVVSWYGPSDMQVYFDYAGAPFGSIVDKEETFASRLTNRLIRAMGYDMPVPAHWEPGLTIQETMMRALFGGTPDEIPEVYRQASPVTYARPGCPPTLLLQGEHDAIVSAEAVRVLARKLRDVGVPVVHVEYPETEHVFDLILPQVSPPAQAALYEVERFLALMTVPRA